MTQSFNADIFDINSTLTIVGERLIKRGKDMVYLTEFKGEDQTENQMTLEAEKFRDFFNALRKFGRAAGLLPDRGDDASTFTMRPLSEVVDESDDGDEPEDDGEETPEPAAKPAGAKRGPKPGAKAAAAVEKASTKSAAKVVADKGANKNPGDFSMKQFIKAIKAAIKHASDPQYAKDVIAMYKKHRKVIDLEINKFAINALTKALEAPKDESLQAKAVVSLFKHVVGGDV